MDYREVARRIDQINLSAHDRAAAKLQLAQAERLAEWMFMTAAGLRKAATWLNSVFLHPTVSKIRNSVHRPKAA